MTIFVGVVSSTVPVTLCVLAPAAKAAPLKARLATANKVIAVAFIVRKSRTSYPLIGAARSVASLKNRKRQIAISLQSVVLLWRRLRQYLDRDGINVSKAIPNRARFRFELRHCPRTAVLFRCHAAFAREDQPLSIRSESRTILAHRSIYRAHRHRRAPFSVLVVADVNVRAADRIRPTECANEKKFFIGRNERLDIHDAFAVDLRTEIHRRRVLSIDEFGNENVDLGVVIGDCRAEIEISVARHRSEELAVRVYNRTQIFRLRPFVACPLAHPDFIVMRIFAINWPIRNEEQFFAMR